MEAMMRFEKLLFCFFLLGIIGLVQGQTRRKTPAERPPLNEQEIVSEIQVLEQTLRTAVVDGKSAWWEKHLDEHYSGLEAERKVVTNAEAIALYSSPSLRYDEFNLSQITVRIFNGDCVIANGRSAVKGSYQDKDFSGPYYFIHVWVKEGPDWKLASSQSTKLPEP
jgi:Domain of unknown function (DUF4440)